MITWYPLKFEPILKEKIWGGSKLSSVLGKKTTPENIGESWEISSVKKDISKVINGEFKGETLKNLLKRHKEDLVGNSVYKIFRNNFPLLIKFIDASSDLSVQLHPNDVLAKKRHNSFGKTEMWHIIQADAAARLILGFKNGIKKSDYKKHLKEETLTEILNEVPVVKGDTFYIPTGTVHAIGAGILLAEIQQTSDITYRVYDWDRLDTNGKLRRLHKREALEAINFGFRGERMVYETEENQSNQMVSSNYFSTNYFHITSNIEINNKDKDSFVIYMCIEGEAILSGYEFEEKISFGETVLIPAALKEFDVKTSNVKLLEVFI
ncbi:type I phosphomannose isomerase catalytic subunit [Pseudofulvibacter geojedonensis]|uniref:Phosphohexomutase n=1 Tax=Pseudofulvibacter geojedonensis TaxID=1123758 RepID=A0ABW3I0P4_9FLAO